MYIYWATHDGVYLVGEGMKALRKIPISIGFVQIPELELFHAKTTDKLDLKSLCSCGSRPKMRIACPDCQEEYTSWQKVPNRGYPISKSEFIIFSQEELESVRNNARKYEANATEKADEHHDVILWFNW